MEGWLEKKGGIRHNWLKRWFVLQPGVLEYHTRPETSPGTLKGAIQLCDDTAVRASSAPGAHAHELEIVTPKRTYRVRAESEDAMYAWIAALNGGGGGGSGSWTEAFNRDQDRDPDGEAKVHALAAEHAAAGTVFEDTDFPPTDASLFGPGGRAAHSSPSGAEWRRDKKPFLEGKSVQWISPQEILDRDQKAVVFSGGIEADDIHQGELGNCYFLAAMAACASHQQLIEDLIVEEGLEQYVHKLKQSVSTPGEF